MRMTTRIPPHPSHNLKINESKAPEWIDAQIKMKQFDFSNDDKPKMVKIGDYWLEQHTNEIVNILKEYQDIFSRDYKDLKGLVKKMG